MSFQDAKTHYNHHSVDVTTGLDEVKQFICLDCHGAPRFSNGFRNPECFKREDGTLSEAGLKYLQLINVAKAESNDPTFGCSQIVLKPTVRENGSSD